MVTGGRAVQGIRYFVLTLEVCLFLALACSIAAGLDGDRAIAQFAHTAWGAKDGAPSVVRALAQSADGYLWLGSPDGLYRFDGVVFERYQPESGGTFPTQDVSSLLALPNGDLWIGFRTGAISLLRIGHTTNYTTREGVPTTRLWSLAQDREGSIWAATDSGLMRLEGNGWKQVGKDWNFPGKSARTVFLDRQGNLWASTDDTLVFLPPGARRFEPTDIQVGQVYQIAQASTGKLWMAETTRSVRPIPLSDKRLPPDEPEVRVGSMAILFDRGDALWITSIGDGLRRSPAPELLKGSIKEFSTAIDSFTTKNGLSDNVVLAIFQDREGNIWVGTNSGLDRFSKTNLIPAVVPHYSIIFNVLAAGDAGDVWVSMVSMARLQEGSADRAHPIPTQPLYAYRDPAGAIWWFGTDAIFRYDVGKYTRVPLPPSFPKRYANAGLAAAEDGSGTIWMAIRGGVFYWKGGRWQRLETEFATLLPRAAFTDWMGRAWFGYAGGTIIILDQGKIQRVFPADDSPVGDLRAINGRGRHLWVGGELGVAFFDGNRFRRIIPADAEAFGAVRGVEEIPDGSLWLVENRSIIQIPASEVQQALNNPSYRVRYRVFDSFDGLPGTFVGTAINQKEIRGTDGRLWFAASGGLVWLDPAKIFTNTLPPPVLVRSVNANGRQFGSLANLVLPPQATNLQIGYTALSLVVPEKVRFRYMLEGVDKEWQEAGTRREAFYTRLGPGEYHFRVIACNNDGLWNEQGARLDFGIAPAWFQTTWFRAFCVCVFLLLLWALYQLRLRQLEQQFAIGLEARVNERTRIARDLHDTLLQTLHGLMFRFQAARNMFASRPEEAMVALDGAIKRTEEAIAESRDAIKDLRVERASTDLKELLTATCQELEISVGGHANPPTFQVIVAGERRDLSQEIEDEVYRIGRELLRNAFQHAQARHIEAEIRYDDDALTLLVRDDGKGIDPIVVKEGGRTGHWGLPGVRERAKQIRADIDFWTENRAGTEVRLKVPGSLAYKAVADKAKFKSFRREKVS
jgi:signal transduction histidine kinase/ligand-binding sensor domain-containing protein